MKHRSLLRLLAICASTLLSVFAGHGVLAKAPDFREAGKNGKKQPRESHAPVTGAAATSADSGSQDPPARRVVSYPWRNGIVTTTFWIGERPTQNNPVPNHKSCWDQNWARNYGGTDTPDRKARNAQFAPAHFVPRQNPFYIALPYNDKMMTGLKPEAADVIPWYSDVDNGPEKSVCKGRWIAIRRGDRVCYAQWEDAGPFRTDHWQYVFGNERPRPNLNKGAGLDVSPAVRDYLGMEDSDVTDWKFVEFEDVPFGPWARFGDNNTFVINRRASEKQLAANSEKFPVTVVD